MLLLGAIAVGATLLQKATFPNWQLGNWAPEVPAAKKVIDQWADTLVWHKGEAPLAQVKSKTNATERQTAVLVEAFRRQRTIRVGGSFTKEVSSIVSAVGNRKVPASLAAALYVTHVLSPEYKKFPTTLGPKIVRAFPGHPAIACARLLERFGSGDSVASIETEYQELRSQVSSRYGNRFQSSQLEITYWRSRWRRGFTQESFNGYKEALERGIANKWPVPKWEEHYKRSLAEVLALPKHLIKQ